MGLSDTDIQGVRESYAANWNERNETNMLRFEKTPAYMFFENVAANLKFVAPQAKILVSLRDPVERAYSNYKHNQHKNLRRGRHVPFETCIEEDMQFLAKAGITNETFWTCDDLERDRRWLEYFHIWRHYRRGRGYKELTEEQQLSRCDGEIGRGLYFLQLQQWFNEYNDDMSRKLIFAYKSENMKPNKETHQINLKPLTDFIGIEEVNMITAEEMHKTKDIGPMKNETKRMLRKFYEPFNRMLYSQLGEGWENPWPYGLK